MIDAVEHQTDDGDGEELRGRRRMVLIAPEDELVVQRVADGGADDEPRARCRHRRNSGPLAEHDQRTVMPDRRGAADKRELDELRDEAR